jgi:hypothetical protein
MKHLFLLLLIFYPAFHLAAQGDTTIIYLDNDEKPCPETKAVKYAIQNKEGDHWKKIVFDAADDKPIYGAYFSDPACTQFDGLYTGFNKEMKAILKGRYTNNKKTGIWKGYSDEGKLIDSAIYKDGFIYGLAITWYADGSIQDSLFFGNNGNGMSKGYWSDGKPKESGNFNAGKKSGLWIYNYKSGMKCQEVKYEADSALSYTCYEENGNVQTKNCYYEKEADFKGGQKAWVKYLTGRLSSVVLPKAYYDGKIYGTVYVLFVVDIDGKTTGIRTLNSIDPELDEIAKTIIRQSPRWEPAVQYNRTVNAYRKQPITFSKFE